VQEDEDDEQDLCYERRGGPACLDPGRDMRRETGTDCISQRQRGTGSCEKGQEHASLKKNRG
jgi:hypothetical protein